MKKLKSVKLSNIKLNDLFWNKYTDLVPNVLVPYQWDILNDRIDDIETSHCIENFKIAAGESKGEYYGAVFQDTDVAKWLETVGYVLAKKEENAGKNIVVMMADNGYKYLSTNMYKAED